VLRHRRARGRIAPLPAAHRQFVAVAAAPAPPAHQAGGDRPAAAAERERLGLSPAVPPAERPCAGAAAFAAAATGAGGNRSAPARKRVRLGVLPAGPLAGRQHSVDQHHRELPGSMSVTSCWMAMEAPSFAVRAILRPVVDHGPPLAFARQARSDYGDPHDPYDRSTPPPRRVRDLRWRLRRRWRR
jgi:hypothetical protein